MKRALILIPLLVFVLMALGASRAREPYVPSIEKERGSFDGVAVEITRAEQADMLADGYDKWGIRGKNIYIEATAKNRLHEVLEFRVTFFARDVFGKVQDSCNQNIRLGPNGKHDFKCMLSVKDARKLFSVTYRVTQGYGGPGTAP